MLRRNFIRSAAGLLIAAPMVVKADSIMRVKPVLPYRTGHLRWTSETDPIVHYKPLPADSPFTITMRPKGGSAYLLSYYDEQKKAIVSQHFHVEVSEFTDMYAITQAKGEQPVVRVYSEDGRARSVSMYDIVSGHSRS